MSHSDLFTGLYDSSITSSITVSNFFLSTVVALLIGLFIALTYTYKTKYTKSFVVTLAILPAVVSMVIMMVNGNIGAGVAVAGAFSLVRFRSVPGTAKEIGAIFLTMSAGLATGMGYLGFAVIFTVIVSLVSILYSISSIGNVKSSQRTMKITIPENLDYTDVFEDIFKKYTSKYELLSVKTTNMGSLFKLIYDITLISEDEEKDFIDDIRCRNGNLEITLAKQSSLVGEL
ncbi:DUF4956 domain-containing protein [Anaerovorax odorimutans]|uniref:DUF4956 domain-containing protein n=1 Tax=Anaerovorax odorimutans TaxID=109327 RepID=UPI00041822F4|nr:DUF4956 domain-containing protein [Anaerovorax odorimutans]